MTISRVGGAVDMAARWGLIADATALGFMEALITPIHPNALGDNKIASAMHRFLRAFA